MLDASIALKKNENDFVASAKDGGSPEPLQTVISANRKQPQKHASQPPGISRTATPFAHISTSPLMNSFALPQNSLPASASASLMPFQTLPSSNAVKTPMVAATTSPAAAASTVEGAERARRRTEIERKAADLSAQWVHPPASTQIISPTLHRIRAFFHLYPQVTQHKLAKLSGVSQCVVSAYVNGRYSGARQKLKEEQLENFLSATIAGKYDEIINMRTKPSHMRFSLESNANRGVQTEKLPSEIARNSAHASQASVKSPTPSRFGSTVNYASTPANHTIPAAAPSSLVSRRNSSSQGKTLSSATTSEDAEIARRTAAVNSKATDLSALWVHPKGSTQPNSTVLHCVRAILNLYPLVSLANVTRIAGISAQSLVSLYIQGRYGGHQKRMEEKMEKFVLDFLAGKHDAFLNMRQKHARKSITRVKHANNGPPGEPLSTVTPERTVHASQLPTDASTVGPLACAESPRAQCALPTAAQVSFVTPVTPEQREKMLATAASSTRVPPTIEMDIEAAAVEGLPAAAYVRSEKIPIPVPQAPVSAPIVNTSSDMNQPTPVTPPVRLGALDAGKTSVSVIPPLPDAVEEHAKCVRRRTEIDKEAAAVAAKWVHPQGSSQVSSKMLHRLRAILNLYPHVSQTGIARIAGISQSVLSLYMHGRYRGNQENVEEKLGIFVSEFLAGKHDTSMRGKPGPSGPRRGPGRPRLVQLGVDRERTMMEKIRQKQIQMRYKVHQRITNGDQLQSEDIVREAKFQRAIRTQTQLRQMNDHVIQLQTHCRQADVNGPRYETRASGVEPGRKTVRVTNELTEMEEAIKELLMLEQISSTGQRDANFDLKKQYQLQRYVLAQQRYIMTQQEHLLRQQQLVLERQRLLEGGNRQENVGGS